MTYVNRMHVHGCEYLLRKLTWHNCDACKATFCDTAISVLMIEKFLSFEAYKCNDAWVFHSLYVPSVPLYSFICKCNCVFSKLFDFVDVIIIFHCTSSLKVKYLSVTYKVMSMLCACMFICTYILHQSVNYPTTTGSRPIMFFVELLSLLYHFSLQMTPIIYHPVLAILAPAEVCLLWNNVFRAVVVTSCDDFILKWVVVFQFTFYYMFHDCKSSVINNKYSSSTRHCV